jgi:hypothetical protein
MECSHCCYSCDENGTDMSFDMFKNIVNVIKDKLNNDNYWIVLGGGEPTVHPLFWKILNYSIAYGRPWIQTNGKKTDDLLTLMDLSKQGIIKTVLTLDKWHEKIDEKYVEKFKEGLEKEENIWGDLWKSNNPQDLREIRSPKICFKSGRCVDGIDGCISSLIHIQPDGIIRQCGCVDSPIIGDFNVMKHGIFEKYHYIDWYDSCYKGNNA